MAEQQNPPAEYRRALTATERTRKRRSLLRSERSLAERSNEPFNNLENDVCLLNPHERDAEMVDIWIKATQHFETTWNGNRYGYVCDICDRIWFERSLKPISSQYIPILEPEFDRDVTSFKACDTCLKSLRKGKIPPMSKTNGFRFPPRPLGLPDLDPISARLISPRIPFVAIRRLRHNGQYGIVGQVVNVPVDVETMISKLPRNVNDDFAINVCIKRRLIHKSSYLEGFVKIRDIRKWLDFLITTPLYRRLNITIDWSSFNTPPQAHDPNDFVEPLDLIESDAVHLASRQQTLLWNETKVLELAPAQGNQPLNITYDDYAEELSFPDIYYGEARLFKPGVRVTPYMVANSEIQRSDRRGVTPAKILYTVMKILRGRVVDGIYSTFKCLPETENITKRMLEDRGFLEECIGRDFAFLKSLPNSAQYWLGRKKDLFAMIKQFGKPTCFLTLSANEMQWPDLLKLLLQFNEKYKHIETEDPLNDLNASIRSYLVNEDPVICCVYFHRILDIMMQMLKSPHDYNPFGKYRVKDFFLRIEFQHRGSPHAHILLWLDNDPEEAVSEDMPKTIKLLTNLCSVSESDLGDKYSNQVHKHTFTCRKRGEANCRFNIPYWPVRYTVVLKPLSRDDRRKNGFAMKAKKLKQNLSTMNYESIDTFLSLNSLNYDRYLDIIRASLARPTIFFKREMNEIYTNTFNPWIASILNSNTDLQFILDEFSCAAYVVDYVNKSNRGTGNLHRELLKLRAENPQLNDSGLIRKLSSRILNTVELSSQEGSWIMMRFNMSQCSRETVYIPTCWPVERQKTRKHKSLLSNLGEDSTDVWSDTLIQKYEKRPCELEHLCLADFAAWYTRRRKSRQTSRSADDGGSSSPVGQFRDELCPSGDEDDAAADVLNDSDQVAERSQPSMDQAEVNVGGKYYKRKTSRIIRYRNYDKSDVTNHKREMVTLFIPFRCESIEVLDRHKFLTTFDDKLSTISSKQLEYEKCANFEELMRDYRALSELSSRARQEDDPQSARQEFVQSILPEGDTENFDDIEQERNVGSATISCVKQRKDILSKEEYCHRMSMTNERQRELVLEIIHRIHSFHSEPLQIFLAGPAGCGKTFLLKLIMETYNRFSTQHNELRNAFVACASTGKAAVNLGGSTVHSAFHLSTSRRAGALARETLQSYRNLFRDVSCIIIDEVSMISSNTFHDVNARLQDISGIIEPFGGINIIFCGDFKQLPPVMGSPIYRGSRDHLEGSLLWSSLDYFPLTQVMRQADIVFSSILTKIGEGRQLLDGEASLIESRFRTLEWCEENLRGAVRLFHTNHHVDEYNFLSLDKANEKFENLATDIITGYKDADALTTARTRLHRMKTTETANLPYVVVLAIGYPYLITTNIDVADGIVNGTYGILRYIEESVSEVNQESARRFVRLWFEFAEKYIGSSLRQKHKSSARNLSGRINADWTPINLRTANISLAPRVSCRRTQFPVVPACAMTIHKSQGGTFDRIVYEYEKAQLNSLVYVALSRVTTIDGLFIINRKNDMTFHHKKGCQSQAVYEVQNEYKRLDHHQLATLTSRVKSFISDLSEDEFVLCTLNAQSLIAHAHDIETDLVINKSDLLVVSETWMNAESIISIDGYELIANEIYNNPANQTHRVAGGVAIFKRRDHNSSVLSLELLETNRTDVRSSRIGSICKATISFQHKPITLFGIYIRPNNSKDSTRNWLMSSLQVSHDECQSVIVTGDFNTNLDDDNWLVSFMRDEFNMHLVTPDSPTTLGNTKIDLTFIRGLGGVCQPFVSYFSYHRPVFNKITMT